MTEPRYTVSFRSHGDEPPEFLRVSLTSQRTAGVNEATSPKDALRRLINRYPGAYSSIQLFAVRDGQTGAIFLFNYEPAKTVPAEIKRATI